MNEKIKCKICNKNYKHLGSHIWHKHKMLAIQYKEEFGLDHKFALISEEVRIKQAKGNKKNKKQVLKNLEKGQKYRFKKGRIQIKGYLSPQSRKRQLKNLIKMKKLKKEKCPVCNIIFNKLDSHLYNKHKLLRCK